MDNKYDDPDYVTEQNKKAEEYRKKGKEEIAKKLAEEKEKVARVKSVELRQESRPNIIIKIILFSIKFILLPIVILFLIQFFIKLPVWISFLLAILITFLIFKPKGSGERKQPAPAGAPSAGTPYKEHGITFGKVLLVLFLILIGFWIYQASQQGYINAEQIKSVTSGIGIKIASFIKDPFKAVRDIGTWEQPAEEVKEVGVKIYDIQKFEVYSSGQPIRLSGKIKIFALEKESTTVQMKCSLKIDDKISKEGLLSVAETADASVANIIVKEGEDAEYGFSCKFKEGIEVAKDEKNFNVIITAKYPNFKRKETLTIETISTTKERTRQISSLCTAGCGFYSGPVRLDLSTSPQPLTKINSIYPLYIKLSNVKDRWSGGITEIKSFKINFRDFEPVKEECESFEIAEKSARLKTSEINQFKTPSCSAQDLIRKGFSNLDACIEAARDKKEYDCWFKVPEKEFVETAIPKKHNIDAELVFDYEFKSTTSITVKAK